MRLVISDLSHEQVHILLPTLAEDDVIITHNDAINYCIGCFGCWVKTPAICVIRDAYGDMGKLFSQSDEVLLISQCTYGGFSPFVKNVLDRSISYIHPYFVIKNGEMHHRRRYNHSFNLRVWFYGDLITEDEKVTAEKLVKANAINLDCHVDQVKFLSGIDALEGHIL